MFIQEGSSNSGVTTSDLHILDFNITDTPDFLLGDVNRDGSVTFADIGPLIALALSISFQIEADIDGNNSVDFGDIGPFFDLLFL